MIGCDLIRALRALPDEFAGDPQVEVCELPGFLLASRPGAESLSFRIGKKRCDHHLVSRWIPVSEAGNV